MEHKVFLYNKLLFGSLLIWVIKNGVSLEHSATGAGKFQILVLVNAPRWIATFRACCQGEVWGTLFCHAITLWAISHCHKVILPVKRRNAAYFKLEFLCAELITRRQFLYALWSWTSQFNNSWFSNIILAVFLLLAWIYAGLQLHSCLRESIVRQESTVGHELYEAFCLYIGILCFTSLYQIFQRFLGRVVWLQSVFLCLIIVQFFDETE